MTTDQLGAPNLFSDQEMQVLRERAKVELQEQERNKTLKYLTTEYEQKEAVNLFLKEGWSEEIKNNRSILDNPVLAIQSLGVFKERLAIRKEREELESLKNQNQTLKQPPMQSVQEPINTQSVKVMPERIEKLKDLDLNFVNGFSNEEERKKMKFLLDTFGGIIN